MFNLLRSDIDRYDNFLRTPGLSAEEELARIEEEQAKQKELIMDAATIGGTTAGLGWWAGRYGMPSPFGIPLDLLVAGASYGIVAFGGALGLGSLGKYDKIFANVGHGSLAHYLTFWSTKLGRSMRLKAGEPDLTEKEDPESWEIKGAVTAGWEYQQPQQMNPGMGGYMPFGQQQAHHARP